MHVTSSYMYFFLYNNFMAFDNCYLGANDDGKKDLRSRGLCLVPVSCTSHFGGDNAADYWAPAPLGGILR
jgi:hypothetical protein